MLTSPIEKKPIVSENDSRLIVRDIEYPGETGSVRAHFARP